MSYRVFVFDIDNTLTSRLDGHFVESAVEALRELRKKGHKVVIASGRMPKTATQLAENGIEYDYFIGATDQIVTDNKYNVLYRQCFSEDLFERISEYCRQNGCGYFWKMDDCSYIVENNSTIDNIFNTYRSKTAFSKPENSRAYGGALVTEPEKKELFVKEFGAETDTVDGGAGIYDVNLKNVSKRDGLRELLRILGISREECMAFGDSENDLELLQYAGLGIAMGDGLEVCRQQADYVTAETYNDGIKKALKRFKVL